MARTIADLVKIATAEWNYWGNSTWNVASGARHKGHLDDDPAYARYVIRTYNAAGGGSPSVTDIMNDHYYWSAVGMSYVFKTAGFKRTEFPFAQAHSVWIRKFIAARKANDASALYHGYRLTEQQATPQVGDIVGYTYAQCTFQQAQAYFDKTGSYPSHTDIVVERRDREIDVIGFNVMDSVTKKTVPLTSNGLLDDDGHNKWFVVLKANNLS